MARTIYITITRVRRRLYRVLSTLMLTVTKAENIDYFTALLIKSALNVASVIVRSLRSAQKNLYGFIFRQRREKGKQSPS